MFIKDLCLKNIMKGKIEKRNYLFLTIFLLVAVSLIQNVSAASITNDLKSFMDGVVEVMNPFSAYLLGDTLTGELLFAKVLFFVVVLSLVWMALNRIPFFSPEEGQQLWVIWVVSIAVSILAVRFISTEDWVQTIILPYTTLGIVLAAGFPFVIFFVLVELGLKGSTGTEYKTIRKVAWVFFGVVFIGLFVSRGDVVGSARNVYFVTAIFAFIVAIFDGTFQGMLHDMSMDRTIGQTKAHQIDAIQREIRQLNEDFARHIITAPRYHGEMHRLRNALRVLQRA